jgi:hypothetical protein
MVTPTVETENNPPAPVDLAVITCVPTESEPEENEAPVNKAPSMLEVHTIPLARFPVLSVEVAENETVAR